MCHSQHSPVNRFLSSSPLCVRLSLPLPPSYPIAFGRAYLQGRSARVEFPTAYGAFPLLDLAPIITNRIVCVGILPVPFKPLLSVNLHDGNFRTLRTVSLRSGTHYVFLSATPAYICAPLGDPYVLYFFLLSRSLIERHSGQYHARGPPENALPHSRHIRVLMLSMP